MWPLYVLSAVALLSSTFTVAELSPDGSCGVVGTHTYQCWPTFGNCCSGTGWCGNSTAHCGGGCDSRYGTCGQKLTPDGTCGGTNGYICQSPFGSCCSIHGYCGNGASDYCGVGCQQSYSASGSCITGVKPSINGTCGATVNLTCTGSLWNGQCCSFQGYCGTTVAHCGTGCQPGFGSGCT